MSSKFGFKRRYYREIGRVLLCKCVPVLTHDVLQTAEDPKNVGRLTNLAKSGYFSAVLSFIMKSTDPASGFCAGGLHRCNCNLLVPDLLWINSERPVNINWIDYLVPVTVTKIVGYIRVAFSWLCDFSYFWNSYF